MIPRVTPNLAVNLIVLAIMFPVNWAILSTTEDLLSWFAITVVMIVTTAVVMAVVNKSFGMR